MFRQFAGVAFATCLIASLHHPAAAQLTGGTGPGGFIQTGPASDITTWLRGDAGVTKDGANRVSLWADQSGRANNQNQASLNLQPTQTLTINGVPVVSFDGGLAAQPDFMESTSSVQASSIFIVSTPRGFNSCCNPVVGNSNTFLSVRYNNGSWNLPGNDDNDYTWPAGEFRFNGGIGAGAANPFGTSSVLALEGDPAATFTRLQLAQHNNQLPERNFRGDIAEVVVLNRLLNRAEKTIVDNHLSSKFNIALNTGAGALERYLGDTPANGHRDFGVFGIGQASDGSNVLNAGADGFGFLVDSGLGNGEFVLAGHDGTANSLVLQSDGSGLQMSREWFVDFNSSSVVLDLAFDLSDAGVSMPAGNEFIFELLASTNGTSFAPLRDDGVFAGDRVSFAGFNTAGVPSQFFTLGITAVPEPTAVLLWSVAALVWVGCSLFRRARAQK